MTKRQYILLKKTEPIHLISRRMRIVYLLLLIACLSVDTQAIGNKAVRSTNASNLSPMVIFPTPAGVPVKIKSPTFNRMNWDTWLMI